MINVGEGEGENIEVGEGERERETIKGGEKGEESPPRMLLSAVGTQMKVVQPDTSAL